MDPTEPEGVEDWNEDEAKAMIEAADPFDARLKPITQDNQL
jgi:hypothetical protein